MDIPFKARTESSRFRWWQPSHRGVDSDQWSVDQIHIGQYHGMQDLQDDFTASTICHSIFSNEDSKTGGLLKLKVAVVSVLNIGLKKYLQSTVKVTN